MGPLWSTLPVSLVSGTTALPDLAASGEAGAADWWK